MRIEYSLLKRCFVGSGELAKRQKNEATLPTITRIYYDVELIYIYFIFTTFETGINEAHGRSCFNA